MRVIVAIHYQTRLDYDYDFTSSNLPIDPLEKHSLQTPVEPEEEIDHGNVSIKVFILIYQQILIYFKVNILEDETLQCHLFIILPNFYNQFTPPR